jgi:twitching motility protein PilU
MDRIINFFPEERHPQLLQDLSLNMRGIVSQRLIPTIDGKRAAAIEVLVGTPRAADLIAKGAVTDLKELMEKSEEQGMQTFDQALYKLYKSGRISLDEALKNADSRNNLRLRITLDENPEARAQADANGNGNLTDEAVDAGRNAEMDSSGLAGGTGRLNNEKDSEFSLIDLDDKS